MKAKEYVAKFKQAELIQDEKERQTEFFRIQIEFVNETNALIKKRGGSDNAIEGVVREQEQKWRAIVAQHPDLDMYTFDLLMENQLDPRVWDTYCKVAARNYQQKIYRNSHARFKQNMRKAKEETDPDLRLAMMLSVMYESIIERQKARILGV